MIKAIAPITITPPPILASKIHQRFPDPLLSFEGTEEGLDEELDVDDDDDGEGGGFTI